jgi:hypothetical protein
VNAREETQFNRLTWPGMNDAIEMQKVVILPTGSTEQHGPHLPLDTDLFLAESVCQELARRAPDKVLLLPAIPYGLNLHHIDFPGTIHIQPQHFIDSQTAGNLSGCSAAHAVANHVNTGLNGKPEGVLIRRTLTSAVGDRRSRISHNSRGQMNLRRQVYTSLLTSEHSHLVRRSRTR